MTQEVKEKEKKSSSLHFLIKESWRRQKRKTVNHMCPTCPPCRLWPLDGEVQSGNIVVRRSFCFPLDLENNYHLHQPGTRPHQLGGPGRKKSQKFSFPKFWFSCSVGGEARTTDQPLIPQWQWPYHWFWGGPVGQWTCSSTWRRLRPAASGNQV